MDDRELIQGLRDRDETAFKWLVEAYRNKVFNTVLNILQDTVEAEDSAQEVFIRVYESISSFKQQSSLSTWIYAIAVRKAIDKLRKRKRRENIGRIIPWWMPNDSKGGKEDFYHPGVALEHKQKSALLFRAIAELPGNQKVAFTLIKVQGMSYEEACGIMGQSVKAIESLISRAKQNLQKKLKSLQ